LGIVALLKKKGPSPVSGDGPENLRLAGFFGWLDHPVRVGRLMPTLIRTRVRIRPRNMLR
jgi:hypothetical protein